MLKSTLLAKSRSLSVTRLLNSGGDFFGIAGEWGEEERGQGAIAINAFCFKFPLAPCSGAPLLLLGSGRLLYEKNICTHAESAYLLL
ncbi:RNA polymerase sigma factor [Nodularia spumigena CCY9414]|nr:RNA polymerase sigma factor [Nodularia spumigena CCY9414]